MRWIDIVPGAKGVANAKGLYRKGKELLNLLNSSGAFDLCGDIR